MPIAGPAANYYGDDRPGINVYGDSIVAVDAETGQYKWHFQTVHHDLWETFKVYDGRIHAVEAFMRILPVEKRNGGWQ